MRARPSSRRRGWLWKGALVLLAIAGVAFVALRFAQRAADGPLNALLPGGPLRAGALVSGEVDWRQVLDGKGSCRAGTCADMDPIELQLVEPLSSRYTGVMERDGRLFVPCDLGFMWGRFEGHQRRVLEAIYWFKRWHLDALRDGRVVLRIDGTRYAGQAVLVREPALVAALKAQLEEMARAWVAPAPLGPPPTSGPRDIWFFEILPRG